jgi:hypothetical protein
MTLSLFKYRQQSTEGTVNVTKYRNGSGQLDHFSGQFSHCSGQLAH